MGTSDGNAKDVINIASFRGGACLISRFFFGMIYFTKIIVASNNGLNADGRGGRLGKVVMQTDIISANNQASHPKTFQTLFVYLKWANKFHTARLRDLRPQIILDGKSKIRKKYCQPPSGYQSILTITHPTNPWYSESKVKWPLWGGGSDCASFELIFEQSKLVIEVAQPL